MTFQNLKFSLVFGLVFTVGCTQMQQSPRSYNDNNDQEVHISRTAPLESGLGTIPTETNEAVEKWLNYFTGRGRPHMKRYLERSSKYLSMMKQTLKNEGVPEDLIYISLIESGFRSKAVSHASAVGYWQFIRGTGKRYGLIINSRMDERLDPVRSTQAAAMYFKALYNLFGNWYLAMASYNAGENRIKRAVMNNYTRDFWELARKRKLPRETLNYVPKFLAAKLIAEDPKKYGFMDIDFQPALVFDEISINYPIDLRKLAQKSGISYKKLRDLNPSFKSKYVPIYRIGRSTVRVPVGKSEVAMVALPGSKHRGKIYTYSDRTNYRVRRGDSLYRIAKKFGTSIHRLKDLNNISGQSVLKIGTRLKIPGRKTSLSKRSRKALNYNVHKKYHKVRVGENLTWIANKYGLSLAQLRKLNRKSIGRKSIIKVGQKLLVAKSELAKNVGSQSLVHIVKRGETLSHIAKKYRVSLSRLTRKNSIRKSSRLMVGKKLYIPR